MNKNLSRPGSPQEVRVNLVLRQPLAGKIQALMAKYDLEPAAACRMLLVDGLEARNGNRMG